MATHQYEAGIFKTSKYLPGHEAEVGPDQLVLIRTDGEFAPASVLLPSRNENNQWSFRMPGIKIPAASLNWADTLTSIPREGFYRLSEEFTFGDSGVWPASTLVQLGYNQSGDPILFIGQRRSPLVANDLFFSDKGVRIDLQRAQNLLEQVFCYQEPAASKES
ncbi:MAG: hypothetical protein V3V08_08895 [Nannocystaceae bacterium]